MLVNTAVRRLANGLHGLTSRVFLSSHLSSREARVSESTVPDAGSAKGFFDWVTF